jgi:hypothetical protein
VGLIEVAFPYRVKRSYGAASYAFVFLLVVGEVEALILVALGIVARRFDLFVDLQEVILPGTCLIALSVSTVFWWRAREWTRERVDMLNLWAGGSQAAKRHTT